MTDLCRQVKLKRGNRHTVTWVDTKRPCKAGDCVRFKGESEWWEVEIVYETVLEKTAIHHEWASGGLDQRSRIT